MVGQANIKPVNLALQGGGAHGAFTWGVLDYLLEDGRLHIETISGTSAGAMNAVVLASGLTVGGRDGARDALRQFWRSVSAAAHFSPIRRNPWDVLMGGWSLDSSPGFVLFDVLGRMASPYDWNSLDINPLRPVLDSVIDWQAVHCCNEVKLFISATNVRTGKVRVFHNDELTCTALMASACLPLVFQAVEIDGDPYWDGGYSGNPVLFPFAYEASSPDIVIVQINPIEHDATPRTAREILNRVNEITFNSSLLKELRAINFVARLVDEGKLDTAHYRKMLVHRIHADDALGALSASSKINAEWPFLEHLFDIGRTSAERWLNSHYEQLGAESTINVPQVIQ